MNAPMRGVGWRYDHKTGAVREYHLGNDGVRRWVDTGEQCPEANQILKGNADLVPAQHAYLTSPGDKL